LAAASGRARASTLAGLAAIVIPLAGRGIAALACFLRPFDTHGELHERADPYLLGVRELLQYNLVRRSIWTNSDHLTTGTGGRRRRRHMSVGPACTREPGVIGRAIVVCVESGGA